MTLKHRLTVVATAAAMLGIAGTTPATAAEMSTRAVHRGSVGCFNYSWGDGTATWTVYYSNTCNSTQQFWVKTGYTSLAKTCITVGAKAQGSKIFWNKPISFAAKAGKC